MRTTSLRSTLFLFFTIGAAGQQPAFQHAPCLMADASVSSRECASGRSRNPLHAPLPAAASPTRVSPRRAVAADPAVSLARLRNAPPPAAIREVERAQALFAKNKQAEGILRLERAVEIHPSFIEAHNNLGVQYMRAERVPDAVRHFKRVLELDPSAGLTWTNLSFALHQLGRLEEARLAAARAVELDSRQTAAHFSLGRILLAEGDAQAKAVPHLQAAAASFPRARVLAAEALLALGRPDEARLELQRFLSSLPESVR